ncbi:secreted RxLR effector protein 161-like [Alnus glutinosa]|uniref:secreted RxLR effector protein 161-like n=1 Tax=Alnus glutinosa TaxID=3517 RepID=UPI002D79081B|nr:secreted RxLR effector protein 161-like [Alnus glutinosa]
MSTSVMISADLTGKQVDPTLHRSLTGSLLYLTASQPDIAFSVRVCAQFQANPKESNLTVVERIIKYVNLVVAGYFDADWAGNTDDRKSTSEGCFYVGNNLVVWMSRKQSSISLSIAEVEYIAAGRCCTQLLWMKKLLWDYGFTQDTMAIHYDNTSATNISKN